MEGCINYNDGGRYIMVIKNERIPMWAEINRDVAHNYSVYTIRVSLRWYKLFHLNKVRVSNLVPFGRLLRTCCTFERGSSVLM